MVRVSKNSYVEAVRAVKDLADKNKSNLMPTAFAPSIVLTANNLCARNTLKMHFIQEGS